jgi:hypothetical protein
VGSSVRRLRIGEGVEASGECELDGIETWDDVEREE